MSQRMPILAENLLAQFIEACQGKLITSQGTFLVKEHMSAYPFHLYELQWKAQIVSAGSLSPLIQNPSLLRAWLEGQPKNEVEYVSMSQNLFPIHKRDYWDSFDPLFEKEKHEGARLMRRVVTEQYERIAEEILLYTQKRNILFLGCSNGKMFDIFEDYGFSCKGIEPSRKAVALAEQEGRKVKCASIDTYSSTGANDIVLELGVLSSSVTPLEYARKALRKIRTFLSPEGLYVHAPFTRSNLHAQMLQEEGFQVLAKSLPNNLFDPLKYPKQLYVSTLA